MRTFGGSALNAKKGSVKIVGNRIVPPSKREDHGDFWLCKVANGKVLSKDRSWEKKITQLCIGEIDVKGKCHQRGKRKKGRGKRPAGGWETKGSKLEQ